MARPKKAPDEQRTEVLKAAVTPAEKQQVLAQVQAANVDSESDFVRRRCLGYQVPASKSPVDTALLSELNRIGVNVNQLTASTHMDRQFVEYWREIGKELEAVLKRVAASYDS